MRREKDPSGHPDSRHDPNCRGVPNFSRVDCNRLVITMEMTLETMSNRLIPLKLFGLDRSLFFGNILRLLIFHSSISV